MRFRDKLLIFLMLCLYGCGDGKTLKESDIVLPVKNQIGVEKIMEVIRGTPLDSNLGLFRVPVEDGIIYIYRGTMTECMAFSPFWSTDSNKK